MKKRIISAVAALSLLVCFVSGACFALANDVTWRYDDSSKTLYIEGSGDMTDYADQYSTPWNDYILSIQNVVLARGVTSVGDFAFAGAAGLKNVRLSDSVCRIGKNSFALCPALKSIAFSDKVLSIADSSYAYNGITQKTDFVLDVLPASYALSYAVSNAIRFDCKSVACGIHNVAIKPSGMRAYFPYTAKVDGEFRFYSVGKHDTFGELLDNNFIKLAADDDSGANTNFSISYHLQKGRTYYISARIFNASLSGAFDVAIEPVSYSQTATVTAMQNTAGDPSDIYLSGALLDGNPVDSTFTYNVTANNSTVVVEYENVKRVYTFSPDDGDEVFITLMMCDVNQDGVVNLKDYQYMLSANSPYLDLFPNFVNYKS